MAKILLVEDNEMNRDMLSRRLQKQGYEVVLAVDGEEGVAKAQSGELVREGETLWKPSAAPAPLDPAEVQIQQGYLEESAVNATVELVALIQAQRMYEMQQHLLDVTANTVARRAIELGDPR